MSILRGKNQNYYEKSLKLDDIPGLFTINKIKPKELKKTTHVTNVHGLMEGQDILAIVEVIPKKEKKRKKKQNLEKNQKKGSKSFSKSADQSVFV